MFEEDQVVDSALDTTEDVTEESYEQDDTITEGEGQETETVERKPETSEQRVARLKRQLEREERKLGIESEKGDKETRKEVNTDQTIVERLDRADLRAEGYRDKGEQDILMKYARFENMDVVDFAGTTLGKTLVKEYRAKNSTPSPTKRTSTGTRDEVAYWAAQLEKGNRAPTAELRTKAREYLAQNKK